MAEITLDMVRRVVEAELDDALSNSNGGAPSDKKQKLMDAEKLAAWAALTAAENARKAPIVKPLVWTAFKPGDGSGFATSAFVAEGIFEAKYTVLLSLLSGYWSLDGEDYAGEALAKAAAQADYVQRILSALSTAENARAAIVVPDEWQLVPIEPTNEMLEANWNAMFNEPFDGTQAPMVGAGYEAALAAAPTPPQQDDLRKAVIEECAQLVEDGYKCRNCGTFGVMAALENCCERLSIDSPNNAELAAAIRALAGGE